MIAARASQVLHYAREMGPIGFGSFLGAKFVSARQWRMPFYDSTIVIRGRSADVPLYVNFTIHRDASRVFEALDVRSCDTFVDLGAHIGFFSLRARQILNPHDIVAVEVNNENFQLLLNNLDRRGTFLNKAVWSTDAKLSVRNSTGENWSFECYEPLDGSGDIETVPIDRLIPRAGKTIVKIDVEGAEYELFKPEHDAWLERVVGIIVETHDRKIPGCTDVVMRAFEKYGLLPSKVGEYLVGARIQ